MTKSRKRVFEKRSQALANALLTRWPQWEKHLRLIPKKRTMGLGYLSFELPCGNKRVSQGIKVTICASGAYIEFDRDVLHIDDYSDVESDLEAFTLRLIEGYLADKLLVVFWKQNGDSPDVSTTIRAGDATALPAEIKKGAKCQIRSWSGRKDRDFIQS